MRNMIGIFQNHDFSQVMFERHQERGHFAVFRFQCLDHQLRELNVGRRIKGSSPERFGHLTRPLCNNPNWRPTSLFEIDDDGRIGEYIVRSIRSYGKVPLGIKAIKYLLDIDDKIRFPEADPLPIIVHGVHHVRVPKQAPAKPSAYLSVQSQINEHKTVLDDHVKTILSRHRRMNRHHF